MRFFPLLFLLLYPAFAFAAEPQPNTSCSTSGVTVETGGPEQMPARTLICDGAKWRVAGERASNGRVLLQIGEDSGPCDSTKTGRLRYSGGINWSFCNGSAWTPFGGGGGWVYSP